MSLIEFNKLNPPALTLGEAVALGLGTSCRPVSIYGYNGAITGTTEETVHPAGAAYAFPLIATYPGAQVEIDSASADDVSSSTGAATVRMEYLDGSFVEKTHTFTMNGTTDVASGTGCADMKRINKLTIMTGGAAAGTIQVRELGDSPVFATIEAGFFESRQAVFTVPYGKKLIIESLHITSTAATAAKAYAMFKVMANFDKYLQAKSTLYYPQMIASVALDGVTIYPTAPMAFPAGVDVYVNVIGDALTDAAIVEAELRGLLVTV